MIKGTLTKFQPLKTGEVSVMVTTTKEYLHELVNLQDKEIMILEKLLRKDEIEWIESNQNRCLNPKCEHLVIFHREMSYCNIDTCDCGNYSLYISPPGNHIE